MVQKWFCFIVVGIAMSHLGGCIPAATTAISGRYDEVVVSTTPSNVRVYHDNGKLFALTPAKLTIRRKDQPVLHLLKEGFKDTTVTLKKHINPVNPSLWFSLYGGVLSALMADNPGATPSSLALRIPAFVGGWLLGIHLPDYVLGGAWAHEPKIDVLMERNKAHPD